MDRALRLTKKLYPDVLQDNDLCFRLRRRRLLEMIREISERAGNDTENMTNGHSMHQHRRTQNEFDENMDLDEPVVVGNDWEVMDMDEDDVKNDGSTGKSVRGGDTLDGVVKYARQLRVRFDADHRPEIKKSLDEVFSLIAYLDPKSSVMAHLLDESERLVDAEMLNSAILGECYAFAGPFPSLGLPCFDILPIQVPWERAR